MNHFVNVSLILFITIGASPSTSASPNLLDRVATAPDNARVFAVLSNNRLWTTQNGGGHFDVVVINSQGSTIEETARTPALSVESDDNLETDDSSLLPTSQVDTSPFETPIDVPIDLTISNTGRWAVAYATRLCLQNATGYGYRCADHDALVGVRFDQQHRLWVSTRDKLIVFAPPNYTIPSDTVPISQPPCKALLSGPGPSEVTVLTSGAFASYRITSDGISRQVQYTISNLNTVFPIRHRATGKNARQATWYVVVGGHLFKQWRSGRRTDTGIHLQGRVTKLLVDDDNGIASCSDGCWHYQMHGSISVDAADIALLADGRFIEVGTFGIKKSGRTKQKANWDVKSESQRKESPFRIYKEDDATKKTDHTPLPFLSGIMPPSCSRRFVYIPDVRVSFSQRTNMHSATSDPNGPQHGWYLGIYLSWPIAPPRPVTCIKQWETYQKREALRRQMWSKLIRSNLISKNAPTSTNLSHIIDQRIEQQRDAAMIDIIRAQ